MEELEKEAEVFVPFLGDFLSIVPLMGTNTKVDELVFVPFLGDFLSIP